MKKTLSYTITDKTEAMQEGTFYVPSACNQISFRHNLPVQYTFLVFVRVTDSHGKVRLQKQLANSEPLFQIGKHAEDTSIGGIPGELEEGFWKLNIILFSEHLKELLGEKEISFHIEVQNQYERITEAVGGNLWADRNFYYSGYNFEKTYCLEKKWYYGDLHTHTRLSDGKELPERANEKSQMMGLDYYVPTEHNVLHTGWPDTEIMIMPGIEITTVLGHGNIFGIDKMPENMEDIMMHKSREQLVADMKILMAEKTEKKWLFSINHPFLYIWKWNDEEFRLSDLDCLEIVNDPTYEADKNARAAEANAKAVLLSDLLWADGYRICAVGGSDSHNSLEEWYPGADGPSIPGDPGTWLFMDGLSPKHLLRALRDCNCYVTRRCKIETNLEFGKILGSEEKNLDYRIKIIGITEAPILFYLYNGKRNICEIMRQDDNSFLAEGKIELQEQQYSWIRFGAERLNGDFLFYGNPITKGQGNRKFKKYGEIREKLEELWKSKEFYLTKMEP